MEIALLLFLPVVAIFAAVTWIVWQGIKGLRFLVVRLFKLVGRILGRSGGFVRAELVESIQFAGTLFTLIALLPLTLLNFVIGRWATAKHYGVAVQDELASAGLGLYRIALANPLKFVGLGGMLEGVERRIPDVVERAPRRLTKRGALQFDGYQVTGTLPAGGSGAQLYLARPKPDTVERLGREGRDVPDEVVIKSFALVQGSTLPQIVRESRALEAANRLGLVLEHNLDPERFFYVMRYVKGEDLDLVIQRMHQRSEPTGLGDQDLDKVLVYSMDLLRSLDRFHTGGLWHKDVKPKNLIVAEDRAHLVDFGLVTPLQSALTLTTHGTEYYRDPEMVRLAMQGVKVHEVDGAKFDLYSAGAVLFSMIENSFPAHGSLSQLTKRCPEALAWVVRRSMADIESRYATAWEMLDDLAAIASAPDPFALRPADLPSVQRGETTERSPFYAFEDDRPTRPAAEPVAAPVEDAPEDVYAPAKPYLLADRRPEPLDRMRRRGRRVLFASAASLFFLVLAARFVSEVTGSGGTRVQRAGANAGSEVALRPSERAAYETAKSVQREFGRRGSNPERGTEAHAAPARGTAASKPVANEVPRSLRLLVLNDPWNKADFSQRQRVEEELRNDGHQVFDSGHIALHSEVQMALGTEGGLDDRQTLDRVQGFLDRSDQLDAIVMMNGDGDTVLLERKGLVQ